MIGKYGRDSRMIYLIDFAMEDWVTPTMESSGIESLVHICNGTTCHFPTPNVDLGTTGIQNTLGMARSFVAKDENGKLAYSKATRPTRISSSWTEIKGKIIWQGRVDDLWSWLHMLIELHIGLPWNRINDEKAILAQKEKITPKELYELVQMNFIRYASYLETLKYEDRPDYHGLFSECMSGLKRVQGSFLDRYEWEGPREEINTALSISESAASRKPLTRAKLAHKTYPFATTAVFKENILTL
ncbi:hypothetical protein OSTOST_05906 [Ostertagia ostertagi]